jgi:cytochrome b561
MQGESALPLSALGGADAGFDFGASPASALVSSPENERSEPRRRYDRLSRLLHWSVAIGIGYTLFVGYAMHLVTDEGVDQVLSTINMSVATVVMALMIVRFVWRFFRPTVAHDGHLHAMQKTAAEFAHEMFYLIIFCVLISGFLMVKHSFPFFGLVEFPRLIHEEAVNDFFFGVHRVSCIALVGMLALHLAAVFKHQKIDKYPVLSRMT